MNKSCKQNAEQVSLVPDWRATILAMLSGNDLTITQQKIIPWQHEIEPAGHLYMLCLSNLTGASENSHISALTA